jgi:hypothetical protein
VAEGIDGGQGFGGDDLQPKGKLEKLLAAGSKYRGVLGRLTRAKEKKKRNKELR